MDPFNQNLQSIVDTTISLSSPVQDRLADLVASQLRSGGLPSDRIDVRGLNLPEQVSTVGEARQLLARSMYPAVLPLARGHEARGLDFMESFSQGVTGILERLPEYTQKSGQFWNFATQTGAFGAMKNLGRSEGANAQNTMGWGAYGNPDDFNVPAAYQDGGIQTPFHINNQTGQLQLNPGGQTSPLRLTATDIQQLAPALAAGQAGFNHPYQNLAMNGQRGAGFAAIQDFLSGRMNQGPARTGASWIDTLQQNVPQSGLPTPFYRENGAQNLTLDQSYYPNGSNVPRQITLSPNEVGEFASAFRAEQGGYSHPYQNMPNYGEMRTYLKGYAKDLMAGGRVGGSGLTENDLLQQADVALSGSLPGDKLKTEFTPTGFEEWDPNRPPKSISASTRAVDQQMGTTFAVRDAEAQARLDNVDHAISQVQELGPEAAFLTGVGQEATRGKIKGGAVGRFYENNPELVDDSKRGFAAGGSQVGQNIHKSKRLQQEASDQLDQAGQAARAKLAAKYNNAQPEAPPMPEAPPVETNQPARTTDAQRAVERERLDRDAAGARKYIEEEHPDYAENYLGRGKTRMQEHGYEGPNSWERFTGGLGEKKLAALEKAQGILQKQHKDVTRAGQEAGMPYSQSKRRSVWQDWVDENGGWKGDGKEAAMETALESAGSDPLWDPNRSVSDTGNLSEAPTRFSDDRNTEAYRRRGEDVVERARRRQLFKGNQWSSNS